MVETQIVYKLCTDPCTAVHSTPQTRSFPGFGCAPLGGRGITL